MPTLHRIGKEKVVKHHHDDKWLCMIYPRLKLNAKDGGNRRFILTEMMEYAETITAEKVRRVMGGYGGNQPHPPPNLPLEGGGTERQADLSLELPPLQGEGRGGGMGDYGDDANKGACHAPLQIPHHATTLDHEFLSTLTFPDNRKPATSVICADNCLLSQEQPRKHGIIFKKIPRDISRF